MAARPARGAFCACAAFVRQLRAVHQFLSLRAKGFAGKIWPSARITHILSSRPDRSQYLAMPRSRTSIARADTGWVAQQKQVFMKWMNSRLKERIDAGKANPVFNLKKDLKDG